MKHDDIVVQNDRLDENPLRIVTTVWNVVSNEHKPLVKRARLWDVSSFFHRTIGIPSRGRREP
jgi:hypothetical protein